MPRSLSCCIVLALTGTAYAQSAASAEADALFDQGRTLMKQKKIAEACTAYEGSQRVSPLVQTQVALADCREQNKQLATAYGLWRDVERQTRAPIDDGMKKLNGFAADRVKALEPRLSKLTIDMAPGDRVPGLTLTRNGAPLDQILLGQQLPIDGGAYTIVARAPGYREASVTIDIEVERDTKVAHLPPLQPLPTVAMPASATSNSASGGPIVTAAPEPPPSKMLPFIVGGAGVVLLGGALGLDLWARSQYDDSKREPDDFKQEDLWSSAKTKRFVAQGVAVAGLAAIGVGAWLFVRARSYEQRHAVEVAPSISTEDGESRAGIVVLGSF